MKKIFKKQKKLKTILLISVMSILIEGHTQVLTLDSPETGSTIHCAGYRVHLQPGYSYSPTGSESMQAKISSGCGPYLVMDATGISTEIISITVNGAGITGFYTQPSEYTFYPEVTSGTDTIIVTINDTNKVTEVNLVIDEGINILSSEVNITESGVTQRYSGSNYLNNGEDGNLNFRIAQLHTEFVKKGCSVNNTINWTSSKMFDEAGNLINYSQSYFNYLGNLTQTQYKNFTENTIIGTQSVYDAYGRSVLTSLPAPIYNSGFCYRDLFITPDNENVDYAYDDFDVPNYTSNSSILTLGEVDLPKPVNEGLKGSVGWYYSDNNDEEPYVANSSYPYTRIEYDPNNPGEIKRSSSPNNMLRMGEGHENKFFTMPVSGELNYLFGYANGWVVNSNVDFYENIGDWDSYIITNTDLKTNYNVIKKISVDADGNESISFIDIEGKLVASCYSGTNDNNQNERELAVTSFIKGQEYAERYVDIHLPSGTQNSIEIINKYDGSTPYYLFDILDLDNNQYIYQGVDGQSISLTPGYYRIINTSIVYDNYPFKEDIAIRYDLNYYDFTLYYYDKAGRLVSIVSPKGIDLNYDPSIERNTMINKKKFNLELDDIYNVYIPYLEPSAPNEVVTSISPSSSGEQQFSMALAYLSKHTVGLPSTDENGRIAQQPAPVSSGIGSFKIDGVGNPYYDEIFSNNCPGSHFTIYLNDLIQNYQADPNDDDEIYEFALYDAHIKCSSINKYYAFMTHVEDQIHNHFCVECFDNPKSEIDKKYKIKIDLVTNIETLREDIELWAYHHLVEQTGATYWTFNVIPNQLFADGKGELIDLSASVSTNEVKAIVTDVEEWTQTVFSNSWYYEQTIDYTYLSELDLNVAVVSNKFGGYPAHKSSEISQYNSLSQELRHISVDKGVTDYLYSDEGLLRFSRNAQQKLDDKFSYVNYDELGRPIQSGEYTETGYTTGPNLVYFKDAYTAYATYTTNNPAILNNLDYYDLTHAGNTSDINFTYYDFPDDNFNTITGLSVNDYKQQIFLGDVSKTWNKATEQASENTVTTWYSYDDQGRVLWMVQKIKDLGIKTIDYEYNNAGDLKKVIYQKNTPSEYFAHQYTYDIDKRLLNVETSEDGTVWDQQAHYYYYQHGPLKRVELANQLQGIDYIYNTLGWLKAINSPSNTNDPGNDAIVSSGFFPDVYGISIDYFNGDYARSGANISSGVAQNQNYNGNIKSVRWNINGLTAPTSGNHWMYQYNYNKKGWMNEAVFGQYNPSTSSFVAQASDYKVNNITYDKNGNILSLNRNAYNNLPTASEEMDVLTYNYKPNTNQLVHVADGVSSSNWSMDIDGAAQAYNAYDANTWEYEYDAIGQMINNKKDNHYFTYNVSGLVTKVYKDAARTQLIATYDYDDKGYRYKKTMYDNNGTTVVSNIYYIRDASGTVQHIYTEDVQNTTNSSEYPIYGASRLGNYYKNGETLYELTDHLGNVRASIRLQDAPGTFNYVVVEEYADYYPFGEKMPGRMSTSSLLYKYGYQGQEHDEETGYDAFELRLWDGRIGRWMSTDPYGQYHSPYLGMGNNPVIGIDPDGGLFFGLFGSSKEQRLAASSYANQIGGVVINKWSRDIGVAYERRLGNVVPGGGTQYASFVQYFNEDGSYINMNGEINQSKPNIWGEWKSSENVFKNLTYQISNDLYLTLQVFPLTQPIFEAQIGQGNQVNLDLTGANYNELNEAVPSALLMFLPVTRVNSPLRTLNAGQFNKVFKGMLPSMSRTQRGILIKKYNKLVPYLNKFIFPQLIKVPIKSGRDNGKK